jgi:galactokinase
MNAQERARALFKDRFPGAAPVWEASAPGRVNLIGEHTDYAGGLVFPAAISLRTWVVAAPAPDGECRAVSESRTEEGRWSAALPSAPPAGSWWTYPAGVGWELGARTPILAAVASDIPLGSGVSSSAALELAFAVLWNLADGLVKSPEELARTCRKAEHRWAGVPCGLMDQAACALGRAGHAMLIDLADAEAAPLSVDYRRLPPGAAIVVCQTGQERSNSDGAYRERLEACRAAEAALGPLRLARPEQADELPEPIRRRARHIITEIIRCREFADALSRGDEAALGRAMQASHDSLRNDYEVSTAALDGMADSARRHPACIGARLTGAGGGGACVALVREEGLTDFLSRVGKEAAEREPRLESKLMACLADRGAEAAEIIS